MEREFVDDFYFDDVIYEISEEELERYAVLALEEHLDIEIHDFVVEEDSHY